MNSLENIFSTYLQKIETRYNLWIGFLGAFCLILFLDHFFSEDQFFLRGIQDALKYTSLGLAIRLLLNRNSLLTILNYRFEDSIQRFDDFIKDKEINSSKNKREQLQFLGFLVLMALISYFGLKSLDIVAFCVAAVPLLLIAIIIQARIQSQDKKLLQEIKQNLHHQTLDIST